MNTLQRLMFTVVMSGLAVHTTMAMEAFEDTLTISDENVDAIDKTAGTFFNKVRGGIALAQEGLKEAVAKSASKLEQLKTEADSGQDSPDPEVAPQPEVSVDAQEAPVIETNRSYLVRYGAGAVVAVTVAGVTYVLYKNGTLKQWGTAIKQHPKETVCAVLFAALTAVCVKSTATYFNVI